MTADVRLSYAWARLKGRCQQEWTNSGSARVGSAQYHRNIVQMLRERQVSQVGRKRVQGEGMLEQW